MLIATTVVNVVGAARILQLLSSLLMLILVTNPSMTTHYKYDCDCDHDYGYDWFSLLAHPDLS